MWGKYGLFEALCPRRERVGKEKALTGGQACAKALPQSWLAHLVGCHQVQVSRVHGIKLHDVVHGLPIGHSQHPSAYYLHALVQADLWKKRPSSTARNCHPQGQAAPGLGSLFPSPPAQMVLGKRGNGRLGGVRMRCTLALTDSTAPPPGTNSLPDSNLSPRCVWALVSQTILWEAAGSHGLNSVSDMHSCIIQMSCFPFLSLSFPQ